MGSTFFWVVLRAAHTHRSHPLTDCFRYSISWAVQLDAAVISADADKHNLHCFIHLYVK